MLKLSPSLLSLTSAVSLLLLTSPPHLVHMLMSYLNISNQTSHVYEIKLNYLEMFMLESHRDWCIDKTSKNYETTIKQNHSM